MSRVIEAFAQYFDDSGDPIENGWLEFLYSGTNNSQKPTYADSEHNIPNTNPVQLSGAGRCPNVYGTGIYKVVLYENDPITDQPGVQVQEFDPVQAEATVNGSGDNFEEWDSTVVYEVSDIVKVGEDYYRSNATANFNNYPPDNADKWEQIDFVRFWNLNVTYDIDDLSVLDGVIYTSLQDENINNDPPTSSSWWSAIGSGTTLLNWTEDGTVFRPVISGYDLGKDSFFIGDIFQSGALMHNANYEIYTDSILALTVDASQIVTFENFPIGPSLAPTADYELANKVYVDDVAQLVEDQIVLFNVYFNNLASPPGTPVLNDLWYVSDNRYLRMYNGATWLDVKSEVYFNNADTTPTGALHDQWYVSDTGQFKVHNGADWLAVVGESTRYRSEQTATAGQTAFSTAFAITNESIYLNGALLDTSEYTVGTSLITLDTGASDGDIISINSLSVPPLVTTSDYVLKAGDTMLGDLDLGGNDLTSVNDLEVESINGNQTSYYKNAIINGGFDIWQRNTSFISPGGGDYLADRFMYVRVGDMRHTITRDTDVPNDNFNYSMKIACTTADTDMETTNQCQLRQRIEGNNIRQFVGKTSVLSYYIKSSKTGIMCICLRNELNDRNYIAETTINVANTWEYKEVVIDWDYTGGTWNYTNGLGIELMWILGAGSNFYGTADTWNTDFVMCTTNQDNFCDSTSNDIFITGVQLESGSKATPFEFRQFQQEVAMCQRYYYSTWPTTSRFPIAVGYSPGSTDIRCVFCTPVPMRAIPTISGINSYRGVGGNVVASGSQTVLSSGWTGFNTNLYIHDPGVSGASPDYAYVATCASNVPFVVDAEL